jgi:membrane protein implicated in regulation of membrane protease activity
MQRIIGIVLGALVAFALLLLLVGASLDAPRNYAIALVVGAIVSLVWPWIVAFYIGRRVRERRDEEVQHEVERQLADKHEGS